MTDKDWKEVVQEFEDAARRDAYGRLQVLLGLVEWTTRNDIRERTLLVFIDHLERETGAR